jgi:AraC family ethanolamine operon transcriptional activator
MNHQRFVIRESESLSEIARGMGWDLQFDQLERGRFSSVVDYVGTDETQFFHKRYHRALCVHGAVPAGMATFLLPAHRPKAASFCGDAITPGKLCALMPGDQGAIRTAAGYDYLTCCFAVERLDRALRALCQRTLAEVLPHTAEIPAPVESVARVQSAAQTVFVPAAGPDEVPEPAAADRASEERVLAALCAALTDGDPPRPGPLAPRNRWRCVRTVRDYAEAHLADELGVETLCRISRVSERTLTTAFREVTGLSPQQFIKARRLTAARHALVGARRTDMSIKSVALGLGFWHLGHFARDYKAHFDESPSETLARPQAGSE